MSPVELEQLLWEALGSDFGIEVATNNPDSLRAKLYKIRRENADFQCLSLTLSPHNPSGALFIVKGATDAPTE